jgi:uncharacterized RDD family membrane protein YckC
MQTLDPYKPPSSDFKGDPILAAGELHYSGFWQRVGAVLVDFIIVSPLAALDYFFGGEVRLLQLYTLVPSQLLSFFMMVYMAYRFGGSPGKLALGMRIVMLDGSPLTMKAALLRYAPMWSMGLLMTIGTIIAVMSMPDSSHLSLSYVARMAAVNAYMPGWVSPITAVLQLWIFASLITVLANRKRRAIHDFIAGTVVVRK